MYAIEVNNVSKVFKVPRREGGIKGSLSFIFKPVYDELIAVNNISFYIKKGDVMGFIGQNGAGKSTTIKMMTGILSPTSGEVLIDGLNIEQNRKDASKKFGVVFGQRTQLWWDIPIIDTFSIFKELYKIPSEVYKENLALFDDILGIGEFLNKPARQLSLGQRMRADLSAALLHNPEILFLDEPTIGLDVSVKKKVRSFIKTVNQERQTTVILTTHDIDDIEKLSKEITVIDHGSIIYQGDVKSLKSNYGNKTIIKIQDNQEKTESLRKIFCDKKVKVEYDGDIIIEFSKTDYTVSDVLNEILRLPGIQEFSIIETSLEDIVRRIYDKEQDVLV